MRIQCLRNSGSRLRSTAGMTGWRTWSQNARQKGLSPYSTFVCFVLVSLIPSDGLRSETVSEPTGVGPVFIDNTTQSLRLHPSYDLIILFFFVIFVYFVVESFVFAFWLRLPRGLSLYSAFVCFVLVSLIPKAMDCAPTTVSEPTGVGPVFIDDTTPPLHSTHSTALFYCFFS